MRVLIIGAGIGGLSCGIRLAARGYQVTILEKNDVPGGRCHRYQADGFSFDTGPTLFMMPDTIERLFSDVGRNIHDYLPLQRIDPAYRITFSDGQTLDFTSHLKALEKEIRKFGPQELESFYKFLGYSENLYHTSRELFIEKPLERFSDYAHPHALRYLAKSKPWQSVHDVVKQYFQSPHLRIAFAFQTLYLGISPLEAPSIYAMLPYIDLVDGVYYPRGGMSCVPEVLEKLFLELGGKICYETEVERIIVHGAKVSGVLLHDEQILKADIVISNVDLPQTYGRFLKDVPATKSTQRISSMKKGCSAAVFLWGLDMTYPHLRHHNLYLPVHYQKSLKEIFTQGVLPEEPAFYVCAASRTNPEVAPQGCESIMVLVPVPNLASLKDSGHYLPSLRQKMLHLLEKTLLPGISHHIVTEKILSPEWYASRYGLADGSTFGFLPTFFQSAMFRPQRRSPDWQGLYFAGAGTHPGNGVPIVMIAGRLAAEAVMQDYGGGEPDTFRFGTTVAHHT